MLKVVHIHTDLKFLAETERFNKFSFSNTIIIIGDNISFSKVSSFQPIIVTASKSDLKKVIAICSNADIVVLYELDSVKSYIALKIPKNITIAWRFFGAELYCRNLNNYLSDNSLRFYNTKRERLLKMVSYNAVYCKLMSIIKKKSYPDKNFADVMKRVDLFLCLSKNEYSHLTQFWKNLPPFVQIPLSFNWENRNVNNKKNLVIIGNSRSIFNNHIDIIELIENTHNSKGLSFLIPFSYGMKNYYTSEIRHLVTVAQNHIELLENLMPYESYFELISKAKAAIYNSYRQMAMGNIFELINSGTKIYLNNHNVMYGWLEEMGLKIFNIEDFAYDLESNNLELSLQEKKSNIDALKKISSYFSTERFVTEINLLVKNKKISEDDRSMAIPHY